MNPKKLGKLDNHDQEPWKLPLPDFIESLYAKRFGKARPDNVQTIEDIASAKRAKSQAGKAARNARRPGQNSKNRRPPLRPKKPSYASPEQVRITRKGGTAIIDYADPTISGVNLTIGDAIETMTDREILDLHNDIIAAQERSLRDWDNTVIEITPGRPQIKKDRYSEQWVPQGDVLRCIIGDNEHGEAVIWIDNKELSLQEFGRLLTVHAGWGMRIAFVPEELVHENPKLKVRASKR